MEILLFVVVIFLVMIEVDLSNLSRQLNKIEDVLKNNRKENVV